MRRWEQDIQDWNTSRKNSGRSCGVSKEKSEKQRPTRDQLTD